MSPLLLICLLAFVGGAHPQQACTNDATLSYVTAFNTLRSAVAKGQQSKGNGQMLPGSEEMFEMLETLSEGITDNTTCSLLFTPPGASANAWHAEQIDYASTVQSSFTEGTSRNGEMKKAPLAGLTDQQLVQLAINSWTQPLTILGIDDNVKYSDEKLGAFANMIYYKSLLVGCSKCTGGTNGGITCLFSAAPEKNAPLYITSKKAGCTKDSSCDKALDKSTCNTGGGLGLCTPGSNTFPATTTAAATTAQTTAAAASDQTTTAAGQTTAASTAASTAAATTTTTAPPTTTESGPITDTLRTRILDMHNQRRSLLANGKVVNGRTGRMCYNATNIYKMIYDRLLEVDAQNVATGCPQNENGSLVSTRPEYGENVKIINSNTIPFYDSVISAVRSWWDQIAINGINKEMLFTQFLQDKNLAPTKFTQMAWGATYRVGCGVSRCASNTVVVCRYAPRGNIVGQYIYTVGNTCSGCSGGCITAEGLCTPPLRSEIIWS